MPHVACDGFAPQVGGWSVVGPGLRQVHAAVLTMDLLDTVHEPWTRGDLAGFSF